MDKINTEFLKETIVPLAVGGTVLALGGLATWLGFFKKVMIDESTFNGGTFIYLDWRGPIRNLKDPFHKLYSDFMEMRKESPAVTPKDEEVHCVGLYFDDPSNLKKAEEFRCCAGFMLPASGVSKEVRDATVQFMLQKGYKVRELPSVKAVHGSFPHKCSMVSYPLGAKKFYPAAMKYMAEHPAKFEDYFQVNREKGGQELSASIEMTVGDTIHYFYPLENREEF